MLSLPIRWLTAGALACAPLLVAACGDDDSGGFPPYAYAPLDAAQDAGDDVAADATADAGTEDAAQPDAPQLDATSDAAPDVTRVDATPDAASDVGGGS